MPITAISTTKTSSDTTWLTIETREVLNLEQMGSLPIQLARGVNRIKVGRGVFKLASNQDVSVSVDSQTTAPRTHTTTTDTQDSVVVLTTQAKDGGWPDPSALNISADSVTQVREFFDTGLSATIK